MDAVCAAFDAAARAGWAHFLPAERLGEIALEHHRVVEWLDRPATHALLVAEAGGAVAGFALARPSEDHDAGPHVGEVHMLYVRPDAQRRGLGRGLLEAAQDALRDAGYPEATLWTGSENHRPRALYEAAGWRLDGAERRFDYLGVELVNLRYRRRLAPA
jgi:GNAT superfamily N-acetyltransferase